MAFYPAEVTAKHKQDFLDNYLNCGSIEHTLKAIGLSSKNTVIEWKARDPEFLAQYLEVKDKKVDILEGLAFQIAQGKRKNDKGEWEEVKVSVPQCTMIIFQLKALKPDVYTDKAQYEVIVKSSQQKALERVERLAGLYNKKPENTTLDDNIYNISNSYTITNDQQVSLTDVTSAEPVPVKKDIPLLSVTIPNTT